MPNVSLFSHCPFCKIPLKGKFIKNCCNKYCQSNFSQNHNYDNIYFNDDNLDVKINSCYNNNIVVVIYNINKIIYKHYIDFDLNQDNFLQTFQKIKNLLVFI